MKVKSMLVGNEQPTNEINWDEPRLLYYTNPDGQMLWIVQSTGIHRVEGFEGMVVFSTAPQTHVGEFRTDWTKQLHTPLSPNQQVILQNSND